MKLYMKEKFFSWTDRFTVKDEYDEDRYYVEGEFLSIGKKLHVLNTNNVELAFIREKILSLFGRYIVEIDGREICQIVRKFSFLKQKYELEGVPWHVVGDFWAHEYTVYDGNREVMHLSKHWFTWGDSYELEIMDPKDELLCLCIVLAVDAALDSETAAAAAT